MRKWKKRTVDLQKNQFLVMATLRNQKMIWNVKKKNTKGTLKKLQDKKIDNIGKFLTNESI